MTDNKNTKNASSIWGGRFDGGVSSVMERINASIDFDRELIAKILQGQKPMLLCWSKLELSARRWSAIAKGLIKSPMKLARPV